MWFKWRKTRIPNLIPVYYHFHNVWSENVSLWSLVHQTENIFFKMCYNCNAVKEINLFWRYGPHCAVCVCVYVCVCVCVFVCVCVCVLTVNNPSANSESSVCVQQSLNSEHFKLKNRSTQLQVSVYPVLCPPPPTSLLLFTLTLLSSLICGESEQHTNIAPDKAPCFPVSAAFCTVTFFFVLFLPFLPCFNLHCCSDGVCRVASVFFCCSRSLPAPLALCLVLKLRVPPSGREGKK